MKTPQPPKAAVLLTPVLPAPNQSGRAWRAWAWLTELQRSHAVHVVVLGSISNPTVPPDFPAASVHCAASSPLQRRRGRRLLSLCVPWLVKRRPGLCVDCLLPAQPEPLLAELARSLGPARVERLVVFRHYLAEAGLALGQHLMPTQIELDLDDLESVTRRSVAGALWRLKQPVAALIELAAAAQYRVLEKSISNRWDRLWLACAEDVATLKAALPDLPVGVRSNVIPLSNQPPPAAAPEQATRLLFVGSLGYPPNQEAALWLAKKIVPRLRRLSLPDWQLDIVGRDPPAWLQRRLQSVPGIRLYANAAGLDDFYLSAAVVLVPLHSGGGTKVKTLEALGSGRALVSTHEGIRGLPLQHQRHCLLADDADGFAEAIATLLTCRPLRERLAQAGRAVLVDSCS